jgi:DNA-binding response OmpR family regulator
MSILKPALVASRKGPTRVPSLARSGAQREPVARSGPWRIVLASSHKEERATWRAALAEESFDFSEVGDGKAALELMAEGRVDLVIAAVSMFHMDALELLRAAHDIPQRPPIVIVSRGQSKIDLIYLRSAALLGAAATFMQPLEAKEFLGGIRAVLRLKAGSSD